MKEAGKSFHIVVSDNQPAFFLDVDDPDLERLRRYGEVTVYDTKSESRSAFIDRVAPADVLIYVRRPSPLNAEVFGRAPSLRMITFPGVGTDTIDLVAARDRGVSICNLPGANALAVAEHAVGLIFAVARSIPLADRRMREGLWEKSVGFELFGKTLGVVGLGAIGSEVARMGRGLGMRVLGWSFRNDPARAKRLGVDQVSLDELCRESDVVSLHLRGTSDAAGRLGRHELSLMKPTAILINTARAVLVDEVALQEALRESRIAGAGLDVYNTEPLTLADNHFLNFDNVVMTAHMADETVETNARMRAGVVDNVIAFCTGKPRNVVG